MSRERLIEASHLRRKGVVYVRQSTPGQVLEHQESTRLQYQLRDVALGLGWRPERIEIIDEDLGVSASGEVHRSGFERLTLSVARGEVGVPCSAWRRPGCRATKWTGSSCCAGCGRPIR